MKWRRSGLRNLVQEIVFGVEDSFVSTLGTLTGIAIGTNSTPVVLLSGVVLVTTEALSMAAGSYLSSKSQGEVWLRDHADDWDVLMRSSSVASGPVGRSLQALKLSPDQRQDVYAAVEVQRKRWLGQVVRHERAASPSGGHSPLVGGVVMGACYAVAGLVPLGAYVLLPVERAILPSVVVTALSLVAFGLWKATLTGTSKWKSGVEMLLVAGAAAVLSGAIGYAARLLWNITVV